MSKTRENWLDLPPTRTVPFVVFCTIRLTSSLVCPGVATTSTPSSIMYFSPCTHKPRIILRPPTPIQYNTIWWKVLVPIIQVSKSAAHYTYVNKMTIVHECSQKAVWQSISLGVSGERFQTIHPQTENEYLPYWILARRTRADLVNNKSKHKLKTFLFRIAFSSS